MLPVITSRDGSGPSASVKAAHVTTVDPRADERWQQLVSRVPSDVFHSPAWMRVLADTYGFDLRSHLALDAEGTPVGGLPFCRISDLVGDRLVTLPFSDYCDPIASDDETWKALTACHLTQGRVAVIRCVHNLLPLADVRWTGVKQAKWHGLDLRPDLDQLWRGFHESTHRAIRKSQRHGVIVQPARTMDELRAFYDMHLAVRKHKYQMLAQPYGFFENIWHHFVERGAGFLLTARYQDQIIAGVLFLRWKDTLYYKFNASVLSTLEHRPNDQLIWEGIQRAKQSGCTALDFGLSDCDQDGLIRYKRKFATLEKTIFFLRHSPDARPRTDERPVRELLSAMAQLFVDPTVPDRVTEQAGERLYRYFS
jgi:CelD/BcsL family acetyltransferase involved in cellulose biosynthesis